MYKIAKSGEVFYIDKGELMISPSIEAYTAMKEREELLRNTVIRFELNGTHYTIPVVEKKRIMDLAVQLPIEAMTNVFIELNKKMEELGL